MSAEAVLAQLFASGVELRLVKGELRFKGHRGAYNSELRRLVADHRAVLIAALDSGDSGVPSMAAMPPSPGSGARRPNSRFTATPAAIEHAQSSPAPAVVLALLLGMPSGEFGDLCRALIGRPGPSSSEEDAAVFAEIVRRCRRAT
jgi:hypothetical protein